MPTEVTLHFVNARGQIDPYVEPVREAVSKAAAAASALDLGPLDIVVEAGSWVIEQLGHCGRAPRAGVVFLALDPENPNLDANLGAPLERIIAHELHHARRWETAGLARTLGDALVSEGLAGRFIEELYGTPPEPWECAVGDETLCAHLAAADEAWDREDYDHNRWFFGAGDLPHWLGYTLGYRLTGAYLSAFPDVPPSGLAALETAAFRPMLDKLAPEP